MQSKNLTPGVEGGVSEKEKFDAKVSPRGENNEEAQRPVEKKETVKSDRGTFKIQ